MNSPLTTARFALTAAGLASQVAGGAIRGLAGGAKRVAEGFDQVLAEASAAPTSVEQLIDQVSQSIRSRLASLDSTASPPIEVVIGKDDSVRVAGDHPHRATIEAEVNNDPQLIEQLRQIRSVSAVTRIVVGQSSPFHA